MAFLLAHVLAALLAWGVAAPDAPVILNPDFECSSGFAPQAGINGLIPNGWTAQLLMGYPKFNSTRTEYAGWCGGDGFIERLNLEDSLVFQAQDLETPPEPGKPFDALIYQRVSVSPGIPYSFSGWMVSLCGGSFSNPNDCPAGYYIAKMLGVDPTGGTNGAASTVIWVEDRRNFIESRWVNLRLAATAQSKFMTLFVRVRSPYRWHGNINFSDAMSLVQAPAGTLSGPAACTAGLATTLQWQGSLGLDIPALPSSKHQLLFDVQSRRGAGGTWTDWKTSQAAGSAAFAVSAADVGIPYAFRVRARAEQTVPGGTWPNWRYEGVWSEPLPTTFGGCGDLTFVPLVRR